MKKMFLAAVTALALVAGPIAVAGPANAGPYPGTVVVVANAVPVKKVWRPGQHPAVTFIVAAKEGFGAPRGMVRIVITSRGVRKVIERKYFGDPRTFRLPKLRGTKRGKEYTIRMHFDSRRGSVYKNDRDAVVIRVKKR